MFLRVIVESFTRSARRKVLAVTAVALGTAVATAMLAVAVDVGDKMGRELRSFGANIEVTPEADSLAVEVGGVDYRPVSRGRFLRDEDLPKLKRIFWRNAIAGFAPLLHVPSAVDGRAIVIVGTWFDREFVSAGEKFRTGLQATNPTWQISGAWPDDASMDQAVAGRRLGFAPGSVVTPAGNPPFRITGVLATGGPEEDQLFVPLAAAQNMAGTPGQFRKLQVSAMIKPDDALARRNPASMTREEYDRWYCTPYVGAIAHQIQEILPGSIARQIRQVAQNEGEIIRKVGWLMLLVTLAALTASALAISSAASTTVIERRGEIALMKSLGSADSLVAAFFLTESAIQGLIGGVLGYGAGLWLSGHVGGVVFGTSFSASPLMFPWAMAVALAVSLLGAAVPLGAVLRLSPAGVLKEEA